MMIQLVSPFCGNYPARQNPPVVLLIDNAPWHAGDVVRAALADNPDLEFMRLPSSSPLLREPGDRDGQGFALSRSFTRASKPLSMEVRPSAVRRSLSVPDVKYCQTLAWTTKNCFVSGRK